MFVCQKSSIIKTIFWETYICIDELVDRGQNIMVARDILKRIRAVFLNPTTVSEVNGWIIEPPYHGRLSSASTGRLAALLFPFEASELNITASFPVGASTSMSSP
jgi:hypothetical protein